MASDTATHQDAGMIVDLSGDVSFGMRMRTIIRQRGHALQICKDATSLDAAAGDSPLLAFVDFNQPVDWDGLAPVMASETPVVAFGSHTYVEGFRAAKAAGVDRTVSNGEFSR